MDGICITMPPQIFSDIQTHLLPDGATDEEAAFLFVRATADELLLELVEWIPIDRAGFAYQTSGYLELADEMSGRVIKRAHDLGCGLVEMHSHPYPWEAQFSPTDLAGLSEFVPHARWRLKQKPYVAIVVAPTGFDGLAWRLDSNDAEPIMGIRVGETLMRPTCLTAAALNGVRRD